MSCSIYIHNNPNISQMEISGTTCSGSTVNYFLNYGQYVCMDNDYPIINLNGLQISGSCLSVTPTPTPTNSSYCFTSGLTYYTATYQCPNDGNDYLNQYGVIRVEIYQNFGLSEDHPTYNFVVTNGTDSEILVIQSGETSNEFIFPKINFTYGTTGCTQTILPNWYISNTGLSECILVTQTPTPSPTSTPSNTPTISITPSNTQTPTVTPTNTNTPTISITPSNTETPTSTPTCTNTETPTNTPSNTQTPSNTPTQTPSNSPTNTQTQTQTPSKSAGATPNPTSSPTQTPSNSPTNTITPTVTPTSTQEPICPEQINLNTSTSILQPYVGTYNRLYSYSGGNFNYAFLQTVTGTGWYFDTTDSTGNYGVVYGRISSGIYYTIFANSETSPTNISKYVVYSSTTGYATGSITAGFTLLFTPPQVPEISNSIKFPPRGQMNLSDWYISYPVNCPTSTPTRTPTQTPTKTNTPTPSITSSVTPTQTQTQTPTPSTTPNSGTTEATIYLNAVINNGGTGITSTVSAATVTLFTSLVSNGLWDKLDVFYPMIGGIQNSMKINAKNPGTYDIEFNGGWTFGISGATSNGINAYGRPTGYTSVDLSQNDAHMSIYGNTGGSSCGNDCGWSVTGSRGLIYINCADEAGWAMNRSTGYLTKFDTNNQKGGFYIANRTANNNEEGWRNGIQERDSSTSPSTAIGLSDICIGARGTGGGVGAYNARRYIFFSLGLGLTDTQSQNFTTIVNTYNTTLGRNSV